jgi:hypothetical protein
MKKCCACQYDPHRDPSCDICDGCCNDSDTGWADLQTIV